MRAGQWCGWNKAVTGNQYPVPSTQYPVSRYPGISVPSIRYPVPSKSVVESCAGGLMFQKDLLQGKRILITGGGTGLGKAAAQRFLELGAEVYICGRRPDVL